MLMSNVAINYWTRGISMKCKENQTYNCVVVRRRVEMCSLLEAVAGCYISQLHIVHMFNQAQLKTLYLALWMPRHVHKMVEKVQEILTDSTTCTIRGSSKIIPSVQDDFPSEMELWHLKAILQTAILTIDEQLKAYYYYFRRILEQTTNSV